MAAFREPNAVPMKIAPNPSLLAVTLILPAVAITLTPAFARFTGAASPSAPEKTLSPYFVVLDQEENEGESEPLPLKQTEAEVKISGIIADVEIRQLYRNTGRNVLEAVYVFPGSTRAAVHGLEMRIGDRSIVAEVDEKRKAKANYEQAKAENKTAALLEQKRPNVFQMSVGHILPGDEIEVRLNYTEVLIPSDKTYEFVFPTVVGPRYSNTPEDNPEASGDDWVANPYLKEGDSHPTTLDIEVYLNAGMPVRTLSCETHPVKIDYEGPNRAQIHLDGSDTQTGNRDFVLCYQLAGKQVATGLLLHEDEKLGENFFLLTVQPPGRVRLDDIPGREYLFVLDTSGSMNGFPLNTARDLMRDLIGGLRPSDKFNVLMFAGDSKVLAGQPLSATPGNLKKAIHFVDAVRGGGGTEMMKALNRALRLPGADGVSRSIIVVTDGYVSFERETFDMVRNNLNRANLFSFGIGSSVNRFCIEGLARAGQGEPFFVLNGKEAQATAARVNEMIASPVLTDVKVNFGDFEVYDVEPPSLPDVFADRPLIVFGKYRGKPRGEIRITGISGREDRTMTIPVEESKNGERAALGTARNEALPYLWARSRIVTLSDYLELGETSEARKEVTNLGLTYNLLTRYTSFIAVDTETRDAEGLEREKVKQPLPLPQGVSNSAIGGGTTPEPSSGLLWLFSLLFVLFQRKRRTA